MEAGIRRRNDQVVVQLSGLLQPDDPSVGRPIVIVQRMKTCRTGLIVKIIYLIQIRIVISAPALMTRDQIDDTIGEIAWVYVRQRKNKGVGCLIGKWEFLYEEIIIIEGQPSLCILELVADQLPRGCPFLKNWHLKGELSFTRSWNLYHSIILR